MNLNIKDVWKILTTASNEQLLDMFRKIAPAGLVITQNNQMFSLVYENKVITTKDTVSNILPMGRWQE